MSYNLYKTGNDDLKRQELAKLPIHSWEGALFHGTPLEGAIRMIADGIYPNYHNELCGDFLSVSQNDNMLSHFSDGEGTNGFCFFVRFDKVMDIDDFHHALAGAGAATSDWWQELLEKDPAAAKRAEQLGYKTRFNEVAMSEGELNRLVPHDLDAIILPGFENPYRGNGNTEAEMAVSEHGCQKLNASIEYVYIRDKEFDASEGIALLRRMGQLVDAGMPVDDAHAQVMGQPGVKTAAKLEKDLDRYRWGLCAEFAVALHRLYKYPLAAFYDTVQEDGHEFFGLMHAFAVLPGGKIVDCYGARDMEEMRSQVQGGLERLIVGVDSTQKHYLTERSVTEDDLRVEPGLDEPSIEKAMAWIQKQPKRYGQTGLQSTASSLRLRFQEDGDGFGREYHGFIAAFDERTGKKVGYVDYAYGEDCAIKMIEVEPEYRRQGVAAALINKLKEDLSPGKELVAFGNFATPEGQALMKSLGIKFRQPYDPSLNDPAREETMEATSTGWFRTSASRSVTFRYVHTDGRTDSVTITYNPFGDPNLVPRDAAWRKLMERHHWENGWRSLHGQDFGPTRL